MSKFILLPGPQQALLPTLLTVALLAFDIPGALSPHPSPSVSTASQPGDGKPTAVFLLSPLPSVPDATDRHQLALPFIAKPHYIYH